MTISKKLTKDQKCTCIASIIAVFSVIFCLLGRNAAYYNHIPSITQSLPKNFATVMNSLMFSLAVMLICIFVKNTRMKLATITYVKLITELLLLSFGININVSADFFYGDLGGLFFIAVDALILLETSNKELDEKRIIGGCWGVISVTLIISALYQINAAIVYRSIYLILFYGMLFYLAQVMPKSFFSAKDEPSAKDDKVQLAKEKLLLVFILFVSALFSFFTYLLVSISMHRSIIPLEISTAKILCYLCWMVLCLSATSLFFVHFKKHSGLSLAIAASITAITATLVVITINSYSYCLVYNYYNSEDQLSYIYFLSQEMRHIINYHGVFASTLVFSFLTTRYINKNSLSLFDDIECDSDDEKASLHIDAGRSLCYLANAFAENNNKTSPFIVASSYENNNVQVVVGASDEEMMDMIKFMIYALAMRLKSDNVDIGGAYETLMSYMSGALYNAYNTDCSSDPDFDINSYLEGD